MNNNFNDIDHFIFDFGGVLYEINLFLTLYALNSLTDIPVECNASNIKLLSDYEIHHQYECGMISSNEFIRSLRNEFKLNATEQQIIDAWNKTLVGLSPDAVPVVKYLKNKGNVWILSNTNEIHFNHYKPECEELYRLIDGLFLSHKIKMRKPNENIFKYVLDSIGTKAEKVLFIDDSEQNIVAAAKLGIKTYQIKKMVNLSDLLHSVDSD